MGSFTRHIRFISLCVITALMLLSTTVSAQDDVGVTCFGTVLDWNKKNPLPDAVVNIINTETKKAVTNVLTNGEGVYQFGMTEFTAITIRVSKDGYKSAEIK